MTLFYKVWPSKHYDEPGIVSINFEGISCENIPEDFQYRMLELLNDTFLAAVLTQYED